MARLTVSVVQIGAWEFEALSVAGPGRSLRIPVVGLIGNSVATSVSGKERTASWKLLVGDAVRAARGPSPWSPSDLYAITLGFSFHSASHGNQPLDIENFIKPTLDAIAAGLFCARDLDLSALPRWSFDDSNFSRLFVTRLADARSAASEGLGLWVTTS